LLERVEKAYDQTLTAIWIGNGAAAVATIQFIGARSGGWLATVALGSFLLGLISLGVGSICYLAKERVRLERLELGQSVGQTQMEDILSKAVEIGLSARRARTTGALIAAVAFVVGCSFGFFELMSQ
jgi:hypothetical protein